MSDEVQTPEDDTGLIAWMFTNDRTQLRQFQQLLDMYYKGEYENRVGIMQGKHKETGELHTLIVGVAHGEDGNTEAFPLARVLSAEEASGYVGPDCEGGWLENEEEVEDEPLFN
jgi:hypothetical protein